MSVAFQKAGRRPFTTGGQWTASDAEKARAYDSVLTYCGRDTCGRGGSCRPRHRDEPVPLNWIGDRQIRRFTRDGGHIDDHGAHRARYAAGAVLADDLPPRLSLPRRADTSQNAIAASPEKAPET